MVALFVDGNKWLDLCWRQSNRSTCFWNGYNKQQKNTANFSSMTKLHLQFRISGLWHLCQHYLFWRRVYSRQKLDYYVWC